MMTPSRLPSCSDSAYTVLQLTHLGGDVMRAFLSVGPHRSLQLLLAVRDVTSVCIEVMGSLCVDTCTIYIN